MAPATQFALLVTLALSTSAAYSGFWRQACTQLTTERIDPIISRGTLPAGHTHIICGGSALNPAATTAQLRASNCTSSTTLEDKSLYWAPGLYYQWKNGSYTFVQASMAQYYISGANTFPDDIHIIAGSPFATSLTNDSIAAQALNWNCLSSNGSTSGKDWPNRQCDKGLQTRLFLPRCWDGKNLDSSDHVSHMSYPSPSSPGIYGSQCPSTHPVQLPMVVIENNYYINTFDFSQGLNTTWPFVWASGNPTAYGLHGDFIFGWDRAAFDNANENCVSTNDLSIQAECKGILNNNADQGVCATSVQVDEVVMGTSASLPGCNTPAAYSSGQWVPPSCPNQVQPSILTPITQSDGSVPAGTCDLSGAAATTPVVTGNGNSSFGYAGCFGYAYNAAPSWHANSNFVGYYMTPQSCIAQCSAKNYTSCALENGGTCYGSATAIAPNTINHCNMPCRLCGGTYAFTVYNQGQKPFLASSQCVRSTPSQYNSGQVAVNPWPASVVSPSSAAPSSSSSASRSSSVASSSVSPKTLVKVTSTKKATTTKRKRRATSKPTNHL